MAYLGNTPTTQSFISGTDYFNGDGSTTAFTLTRTVNSVNDVEAVINNVVQQPNTAYNISGTTITFTSAPSAGTANIYVRYLSTTTQSITPSQNTVSYSSLNSDNQSKLGISFKNRIINGAMMIDQRNAGAALTVNSTAQKYAVDRFYCENGTDGVFTIQQSSNAPAGFTNSVVATVTSTDSSLASSQYAAISQQIEGYNFADFNFGSSNAKTFTLSFWVYSSITGTFGGSFRNSADSRCYPFTYAINAANTWEQKTITVAGDTTGTWIGATNGIGIKIWWSFAAATNISGTAGAWASSLYLSATGAVNMMASSGATWYITGVQFEVGTQATNFDYRDYGRELILCNRYFYQGAMSGSGAIGVSSQTFNFVKFPQTMRTTPTIAWISGGRVGNGASDAAITGFNSSIGGTTSDAALNIASAVGSSTQPCIMYQSPIFSLSAEL